MPATIPPWLATMRQITGTRALDNGDNPVIMSWPQKIGELFPDTRAYCRDYTHDSIAWCGLTVGYCMAVNGIKPVFGGDADSRFLWALAWKQFGTDAGGAPQPGDVLVFEWASGGHHVTLYEETNGNSYVCLGGNQDHQVKRSNFPRSRCIAIRRPPAAAIAPTTDMVHSPAQMQSRVIATVFGGASDPKTSAYDGHMIDDTELGVALPAHISDPRPNVSVSKDGKTVICKVVHIGPWNTDDAYWKTGARPQAESGVDSQGHRTNGAGIDLTPAAAKAIGLIDKGEVDWEFVGAPLTLPFIPFPFHRDSTSPDLVQQLLAQLEAAKMPTNPTTPPAGGQPDIATLVAEALKVFQTLGPGGQQQLPTGGTAATPDHLQQFIKVLSALTGDFGGPKGLGQVNGALGDTVGHLLDGKKSAIGIIGSVLTAVLHVVGPSLPAAVTTAIGGPLAPAILPIFLGLTAWGVLGKFEKWMPPTTPPKQ
ncbi:hypothetical protein [Bradyrhizobium betae]|nr:hypothetical protein [Bradyrhizobium betae]